MPVTLDDEATRRLTAPGETLEVVEETIRGRAYRVWKNAPATVRTIVEMSAGHGDADFVVYEDERITFAEHLAAVASLARVLVDDLGVAKGDRVAVAMRNYPEWPVAFYAACVAGAIAVPLNSWWTGEELAYGLSDSQTTVLLCDGERADRVLPLRGDLTDLRHVVVARSEGDAPGGTLAWGDVLGSSTPGPMPDVDVTPDDDATIFYTSGTTGFPKGALGTHRNITTNLMNLAFAGARGAALAGQEPGAAGTARAASLLSVPFFHATGCHSTLVPATAFGSKLVLMYRFDPERALELIERERVTSFGGVPTMVWRILESPDISKRDVSSVQRIGYGGAPAPPELVRRIVEVFGDVVSPGNGYGLTETSSLAVGNGGAEYIRKPDSVGRPLPVVDAKVVSPTGEELPTGETGELWLRGPNVVKGYWNKPAATADTITPDGWLRTGDVARIDDEGFLYIVDRAKDMVIRGGENVYCAEVEAALFEHPDVLDAAVIGVPHRTLGEEVGAVVQPKPGRSIDRDAVRQHVASRLAAFKVPEHVWVVEADLPRNPAGKVLKRKLKEELLGA